METLKIQTAVVPHSSPQSQKSIKRGLTAVFHEKQHTRRSRHSLLIILNSLLIIFLASCTPAASDALLIWGKTAVFKLGAA